jgi:hypothetical protein
LCFKQVRDDNQSFANFDIRVLGPTDDNQYGHIETFYEGEWTSDFKQSTTLWNAGYAKYNNKKLFRLSDCSKTAFLQKLIKFVGTNIISEACAESSTPLNQSSLAPLSLPDILLAQSREWSVKEVFQGEGSNFILYNKEKEVQYDSNSPYVLFAKMEDHALAKILAEDVLHRWVKQSGKDAVQKKILEFESFTILQKEVYLKNGFKLPENYQMTQIK